MSKRDPKERAATWTHEVAKTSLGGVKGRQNLYYFAISDPPWAERRKVEANIILAHDGTLAAVELISGDLPPPPDEPIAH